MTLNSTHDLKSAFNPKRNLQPLACLSLHNRGAHKSKARALSLSLVVGSQAPLGAGFGNLFPSAVGNSLGSSTLGGIASGLDKNPIGVALALFFFNEKKSWLYPMSS